MKKIGIVSNKTNKRDAGSFLLFVFLLPYVCACLWGHVGEDTEKLKRNQDRAQDAFVVEASVDWGVWTLPMEEYLAYRLCLIMPEDYETEAAKAQAVLLRTELFEQTAGQEENKAFVDGGGLEVFYRNGGKETQERLRKSRQAVEATKGEILTFRGEPVRAFYFRASNGSTRDAGDENYPYLKAVVCEQDREAPDYRSVVRVEKTAYIRKLREALGGKIDDEDIWENGTFSFDGAGYMTSVSYFDKEGEKKSLDGEAFRHLFGLSSASFEADLGEDIVVFHVTGVGHGFGMSQYEAGCMAENGENYREILAAFFSDTELEKIE